MFSTLKIAHAVHVAGLKVFTAKTVVGIGMVAGTAATGYVINGNAPDDYIDRALLLINHAVEAECGVTGPVSLVNFGVNPQVGIDRVANLDALAPAPATPAPAPTLRLDIGPILREAPGTDQLTAAQRATHLSEMSRPSAIGN